MSYSLKQLAKVTAVSETAIRHWVKAGVIPQTVPRGPNTQYDERHLHYVLAVRGMRAEGMHMRAIGARLERVTDERLRELAGLAPLAPVVEPPTATVEPPAPAPPAEPAVAADDASPAPSAYRASAALGRQLWEIVELCPGVSLCVRADADTEARRVATDIQRVYGGAGRA